jgi:hypothetical protein
MKRLEDAEREKPKSYNLEIVITDTNQEKDKTKHTKRALIYDRTIKNWAVKEEKK